MKNKIYIVIGSWGSYNECGTRSGGSEWLDLSEYSDWSEIVEDLKREGFELDGSDDDLFIQDEEGIDDDSMKWGDVNPKELFNTLKKSGVLDDEYKYKVLSAFLEVRNYDEFRERVDSCGNSWADDINLFAGYSWEDYGREVADNGGYEIPPELEYYIDYDSYGRSFKDDGAVEEYSGGIIEIY